jgi:hypothetical protein
VTPHVYLTQKRVGSSKFDATLPAALPQPCPSKYPAGPDPEAGHDQAQIQAEGRGPLNRPARVPQATATLLEGLIRSPISVPISLQNGRKIAWTDS